MKIKFEVEKGKKMGATERDGNTRLVYINPHHQSITGNVTLNGTINHISNNVEELDVAFVIQEAISLVINVPLLVYIISERKLRRQKPNKFFVNLLTVHILLSTAAIMAKFYTPSESVMLNNGFFMEMFFSLVICTFDRYVNIAFPYKYVHLTTGKIIIIILMSWAVSSSFVTLIIIFPISAYQITVICTAMVLSSCVVLTTSNVHIYIIAKRHAITILKNNTAAVDVNKEKRALKATYVCFALVMSFIILWLPLLVHNGMVLLQIYEPANEKFFTKAVFNVGCLNSIIDPILYICFRKDIRLLMRKGCAKSRVN